MKHNPSRTALATVITIVVVVLIGIAIPSAPRKMGYYPFRASNVSARPDFRDKVQITPDLDFDTRVRATLNEATGTTPRVSVDVLQPAATASVPAKDELRPVPMRKARDFGLEFSAILFAVFGLFVLWWGRDEASMWLGLFCATFAPAIFEEYCILPPWADLVAQLLADGLFFISIYAFLRIAETFALEAMPAMDPVRARIANFREVAAAVLILAASLNFVTIVGPTVFGESPWDWVSVLHIFASDLAIVGVLCIAPIAVLVVGWRRAGDSERTRVRIALLTTLAAESGVIIATMQRIAPIVAGWQQIALGHLSWDQVFGTYPIGFSNAWYTLLAIPAGFIFCIPAYKVIEVKFVLNRLLVLTTMTLVLGCLIVLSETWADYAMKDQVNDAILKWFGMEGTASKGTVPAILRFLVAFTIVLSFSRFYEVLENFFKALFFRRRDEGVKALSEFALHRARAITTREDLLQQAVAVVCSAVGTCGAAIYEESNDGYELAATCGQIEWPQKIGENDPAFAFMRGGRGRIKLGEDIASTESALGTEGITLRMAARNRMVGSLVIGGRMRESDGPYEVAEVEALQELTRSVSEALFVLRTNQITDFVRKVADGTLVGSEAARFAETLCEKGMLAAEGPVVRKPKSKPLGVIVPRG